MLLEYCIDKREYWAALMKRPGSASCKRQSRPNHNDVWRTIVMGQRSIPKRDLHSEVTQRTLTELETGCSRLFCEALRLLRRYRQRREISGDPGVHAEPGSPSSQAFDPGLPTMTPKPITIEERNERSQAPSGASRTSSGLVVQHLGVTHRKPRPDLLGLSVCKYRAQKGSNNDDRLR